MSSDAGETIRLRPHTYFEAEALRQKLEDLTSIDQLLELEHELMIQIERLEVVERMVEPAADAAATRQQIRETLRLKEQQAQSMFTALLKTVKEADRDMEIQVRSFEAFLKEAKIEQKPGVGQYLFVLNADPNDLMRNPKLAERFPDLSGIGQVRTNVFGLWVLGLNVRLADQAAGIGVQAKVHSAVAVMNLDTRAIPEEKRLDALGARKRNPPSKRAEQIAAVRADDVPVLADSDLDWITDAIADKEGMEHAVLCFSPIRMREETVYDNDMGDIVIPSSYAVGGKLFYLSMVSAEEGIATSPFQASTAHRLGDYGVVKPRDESYGPFLYNLETRLDAFKKWPIVSGQVRGGHESAAQFRNVLAFFGGQNTARGPEAKYQIASTLSYEYLRRVMSILAPGMEGKPQADKDRIIRKTQEFLVKNLAGTEASKPFLRIKVREDTESPEAQDLKRRGGLRLIVEPSGKVVISDVSVAIMPTADET
jgi:hypothetical protein